jgi:hypothetical protein
VASSAWLVSGLSPSPLVNSLLPALATLPALLPLRRRTSGYGLQLAGLIVLLAVSAGQLTRWVPSPALLIPALLAVLVFALGGEISQLPLQRQLLERPGSSIEGLRLGSDVGALAGNVLTAVLFPALVQFAPALLLLLPLGISTRLRGPQAEQASASSAGLQEPTPRLPFNPRCALQGLVFGSLFALLPLWVRAVGAGNCFDFAMVLSAYGLGRGLTGLLPPTPGLLRYGLMAGLLALAPASPGWGAVLLFVPLGALAAASDAALVTSLAHLGDAPLRWQVLQRSGAVGGLAGSLAMGLLTQILGITLALPLQVVALLAVAWPLGRGVPAGPSG